MALINNGALVEDDFVYLDDDANLPEDDAVIVSLERWQASRENLLRRSAPVGLLLKSDQLPECIGEGLQRLAVIALEFPAFRDWRAYSYARLLRDKYAYKGELRAVGDILLEQLHFMVRTGFDSFEFETDDPLRDFEVAASDFSVWYQPTGDGRDTASELRWRHLDPVLSTCPVAGPKRTDNTSGWRSFLARRA